MARARRPRLRVLPHMRCDRHGRYVRYDQHRGFHCDVSESERPCDQRELQQVDKLSYATHQVRRGFVFPRTVPLPAPASRGPVAPVRPTGPAGPLGWTPSAPNVLTLDRGELTVVYHMRGYNHDAGECLLCVANTSSRLDEMVDDLTGG